MFTGQSSIPGEINAIKTALLHFTAQCFANVHNGVIVEFFIDDATYVIGAEYMARKTAVGVVDDVIIVGIDI